MVTLQRQIQHNDDATVSIFFRNGEMMLLDEPDYARLSSYRFRLVRSHSLTYASIVDCYNSNRPFYRIHRFIMNCPPNMEVHHRNFITLDNRRENLVIVSPQEHKRLHVIYAHSF